jgi:hypothetical protein
MWADTGTRDPSVSPGEEAVGESMYQGYVKETDERIFDFLTDMSLH